MTELEDKARALMRGVFERGMLRTWYRHKPEGWKLVSGLWSPFYLQLRELCSYPELLQLAGETVGTTVRQHIPEATRLVGIAFAGIPIAVAASLSTRIPCAMTRKLAGVKSVSELEKELDRYGQHSLVEGEFVDEDVVVLIDDLVTRFDSKAMAASLVRREFGTRELNGAVCRHVVVLIDREQGAQRVAQESGFELLAAIPLRSKGLPWLNDMLSPVERRVLSEYLDEPSRFQDSDVQARLRSEATHCTAHDSEG